MAIVLTWSIATDASVTKALKENIVTSVSIVSEIRPEFFLFSGLRIPIPHTFKIEIIYFLLPTIQN